MNPTIGMPQMGRDLFRRYMKQKYVKSLEAAGARVHWIDLEDPEQAAAELLECDGLLLPGGADVDPGRYGQTPGEACGKPNLLRDAGEWKMLDAFLPTGKPILCICRGVQLLNVFCGGSLYQDIKTIQSINHSDFPSRIRGCHKVTLAPDSRLAEIFGHRELTVNSMHHQAVEKPGRDLLISARSQDGFAEAAELSGHPFCIGVQWHPEHMSARDPIQRKLFEAFVTACRH